MKAVTANKPLVSIVTPCYNGAEYLDTYFASILGQTYSPLELIFVDDGSTDATGEIAQAYRSKLEERGIRFVYLYQPNAGQAAAMNKGLKEATGKYLVWPDSDDWLDSDSIELRVEFLETHPQYRFVRSSATFFDYETKQTVYREMNFTDRFHEDIFLDLILEATFCFCGCYMIRLDDLREVYPDLMIYESSAGQNWQILIPIAGRHLCGYIDKELYHIALRKDSHSRHSRTLDEVVARYLELKRVLEGAVAKAGRTDRDYQYMIDVKYDRILFRTYVAEGAFDRAEEKYRALKSKRAVDYETSDTYYRMLHPRWYRVYRMSVFVKRACRKMARMLGYRVKQSA